MLNLQCTPKLKPYLETDDPEIGGFIVDASLTYSPIEGAIQIPENVRQLQIVIINTNTSQAITAGIVEVNTLGNFFRFPLTTLGKPSIDSYQVLCQAYANDEFLAESPVPVQYLPVQKETVGTNAVRINSESGTLMVKSQNGTLETLIPFGYAIDYSKVYSSSDIETLVKIVQNLKVNTVQLILGARGVADISQLGLMLRKLGEAGIWVQYDMRGLYMDPEQMANHLKISRQYANVLLYHTAMEPDGKQIKVAYPFESGQGVKKNDPYHPISLTLNCEDYYFSNYTQGNDIILTNPFVIGRSNERLSVGDSLDSTSIYGSGRCDNCKGSFLDLVNRIRIFRNRRHLLRKDRTMQIWGVPQASKIQGDLGRGPTGQEFLLMCTIYIIEGAVGLMTWNDKMDFSPDLKKAFQTIGSSLPLIGQYLAKPQGFLPIPPTNSYPNDTFIANLWIDHKNQTVLVMAANLAADEVSWQLQPPALNFNSTSRLQTSWLYISEQSQQPQIIPQQDSFSLKGKLKGYGFGCWIIQANSTQAKN